MTAINFYLREDTPGKEKPIYVFVGIGKKRYRVSIKEKIALAAWNKKEQRPRLPKMHDSVLASLYNRINTIETDLKKEFNKEAENGSTLTENEVKGIVTRCLSETEIKIESTGENFYSFADRFIETATGKKTAGTIRTYRGTVNCLKEFERTQNVKVDFDTITLSFYDKFTSYLLNDRMLTKNTIGYRIKVLKTILKAANDAGIVTCLDFTKDSFKKWSEEADTIYLNEAELEKIFYLDLSRNPRLDKVRDLFLIGCYTGLRFSDFTAFDRATITNDTIRIRTQKTNSTIEVPIHTFVRFILNKYENKIPKALSNQKINDYLKELGKMAGIANNVTLSQAKGGKVVHIKYEKWQKISSHTARRSFATNAYLAKMETLSIMKITGHETEKAFLKYIKISAEENAKTIQSHSFFNPEMKSELKAVL